MERRVVLRTVFRQSETGVKLSERELEIVGETVDTIYVTDNGLQSELIGEEQHLPWNMPLDEAAKIREEMLHEGLLT